jgi:hypothetical protein
LHVDADPLGKKHAAIKKRQNSSCPEGATTGQDVLQFVQQKSDVFAMMQKQLIVRPIRNLIEPNRPAV